MNHPAEWCAFHGNYHRTGPTVRTQHADTERCIYEVDARMPADAPRCPVLRVTP